MELLGQRAHGLGEQAHRGRGQGQLAALGAHHGAGGLDDISQVHLAQGGHALLAQVVDAAEQLHLVSGVLEHDERHLTLAALGANAAGDRVGLLVRIVLAKLGVARGEVCHVVGHVAVLGIGVAAGVDDGLSAGETRGALVVERGLVGGLLRHAWLLLHGQALGAPAWLST